MTALVQVEHVTRRYRGQVALDDVSFAVEAGAITGLLGRNGAGKSTAMRIITGQEFATAGTVRLGASPRAAISLIRSAQAYAVLTGRPYVTPQDVQAVAVACLAHRLIAEGSGADGPGLVARILAEAPVPPT